MVLDIRGIAARAQQMRATRRNGAQAQDLRPLRTYQLPYHLVLSLYYAIFLNADLHLLNAVRVSPAVPAGGPAGRGYDLMVSAAPGEGGSGPNLKQIARRILNLLPLRPEFTPASGVFQAYNAMRTTREPAIDRNIFEQAIELLQQSKKVESVGTDKALMLRRYNQVLRIQGVGQVLHAELEGVDTLQALAGVARQVITAQLFSGCQIYFVSGKTGAMKMMAGKGPSTYAELTPIEPGGVFAQMREEGKALRYFPDPTEVATADEPLFRRDVERDIAIYGKIGPVIYCMRTINDRGDMVAVKLHEWEASGACPLYAVRSTEGRETVNDQIGVLVGEIATRAAEIIDDNEAVPMTKLLERRDPSATPLPTAVAPPSVPGPAPKPLDVKAFLGQLKRLGWRSGVRISLGWRDVRGHKLKMITIDKPAQVIGDVNDFVCQVQAVWAGFSDDFVAKVITRSTKLRLTIEKMPDGSLKPIAYSIVTRRKGHGVYMEIFGVDPSVRKIRLSTRDVYHYVKEALIEDLADKYRAPWGWFKFFQKTTMAMVYVLFGVQWALPKEFADFKIRASFLTDTSVALGPFLEVIPESIFPNPRGTGQFRPQLSEVREMLPTGYNLKEVKVGEIPAIVVESHVTRQTKDIPVHSDEAAEAFVRQALAGEKPHDLLVVFEVGFEQLRNHIELQRQKAKGEKRTHRWLGAAHLMS